MNFIESLDMLGIHTKEIPCISGKGAPTTMTEGAVGVLYMDTDTGEVYKCTAVSGVLFTWEPIANNTQIQKQIDALTAEVAELNPMKFLSISSSPSTCEMGQTVNAVTVNWSLNKEAVSQTVGGEAVAASARSANLSGLSITSKYTVTVTATDAHGKVATATATVNFYNGVYYGVLDDGAALTSEAVLCLSRKLQGSKGTSFTTTAGAAQRIAYALPARYGTPSFNVGGFDGGFYLAGSLQFQNASGYTESYNVWLSDQVGLGVTTVKVT